MSQFEQGGIVGMPFRNREIFTDNRYPVDIRRKAIEAALSVTSGAYQTSLLSYFTHRDLFPSLMKV